MKALLRASRYFNIGQLVMLFKSQVLSYLESGVVAFSHAPATRMAPVDRIQRRFLRAVGLSEEEAIVRHNFAPMRVRRQIAALGVLHKRTLGLVPPPIAELLPFDASPGNPYCTRRVARLHSKQLMDRASGHATDVFRRSLFGHVAVYNRLPQAVVDLKCVRRFQACLQHAVRDLAGAGRHNWQEFLSQTDRTSDIAIFQRCFTVL